MVNCSLDKKIKGHEDALIEDDPFLGTSQSLTFDYNGDDGLYMRDDHAEGIWINPSIRARKRQASLKPTRKRKRLN